MEDLISNVRMLYEHSGPDERPASPPLPSPPAHEEGALNSRNHAPIYGSSHTVIKTLPAHGQAAESSNSTQPPKLPPRQGHRGHNRRATISTSQADAAPTAPAPSRPSEDGRSTNHTKAASSTPSSTVNSRPKLDTKNHSASASISSSPVRDTSKDRPSKPSSRNTSEVALTFNISTSHLSSEAGPSSSSLHLPVKQPSYPNSLLHEPAVLLSQANEINADVQEIDYPGSPDTSALEFRTAVNTPSSEEEPSPFSHL
jgi:hypothetical protein